MEKITDILYDVANEFENEIDDARYKGKLLNKNEIELVLYFINCYKYKVELLLKDSEVLDNER